MELDPLTTPCASPSSPDPSIKDSTGGAAALHFGEAALRAASFMAGCGEAGEALMDATPWQLRYSCEATLWDLACTKGQKRLSGDVIGFVVASSVCEASGNRRIT